MADTKKKLGALGALGKRLLAERPDEVVLTAAQRAEAGRKAAELIKTQPPTKASEALGQLMEKGVKRTTTTQADRTRVGGGNIGGAPFSAISQADPNYAGKVWGVMDEGTAARLKNLTTDDTAWTTMLGSANQLKTNPIVFEKLKRGFIDSMKQGNLSKELAGKINHNLELTFGAGADIRDPKIWRQADTFEKRAALADAMMGQGIAPSKGGVALGGEKSGKGVIFKPTDILKRETEPTLLHTEHGGDVPTFAAGPRLFRIEKESEFRPDLHPGFPTLLKGEDYGINMIPTPTEVYLPDWHKKFKKDNPERYPPFKTQKQAGPGYYDLALGVKGEGLPSQELNDEYIRHLLREGFKDGGEVDLDAADARLSKAIEERMSNGMAKGGEVDLEAADARLTDAINARMGMADGGVPMQAGGKAGAAKGAANVFKRLFADDEPYKQVSGMTSKLVEEGRTPIIPVPNRWFLQPDKFPNQQKLVERVLQQSGKSREDFMSGAFIDPRTGEVLDSRIMDDLGVVIDPKTNRPMMSAKGQSGIERLDPKTGAYTKSNLVRKGLFKPEGGDPLLNDLNFLATIEKGDVGHKYGLATEYASPTELFNTGTGANPTLRPRSRGDLFGIGDVVGQVRVGRSEPHDVYEKLFVAPKGSDVQGRKLSKAQGGLAMADGGKLIKNAVNIGKRLFNFADEAAPAAPTFSKVDTLPTAEREANLAKFLSESKDQRMMYHGTRHNKPNWTKRPTGEGIREFDVGSRGMTFVSPKSEFANAYGTDYAGDHFKSGAVYPVHVQVRNPFDFQNTDHLDLMTEKLSKLSGSSPSVPAWIHAGPEFIRKRLNSGAWDAIEDPLTVKAAKNLGFDSMYMNEDGVKNLGVFDPKRIKSAIGNRGTYDVKDADITKAEGGLLHMADAGRVVKGLGKLGKRLFADEAPKVTAPAVPRTLSAGDIVNGMMVRKDIPNTSSIGASLTDYSTHGLQEVPMSAFDVVGKPRYRSAQEEKYTKELARQIQQNKELNPLIVVKDAEGHYILEGGHRFDALRELDINSFPALMVHDLESLRDVVTPAVKKAEGGGAFKKLQFMAGGGITTSGGYFSPEDLGVNPSDLPSDVKFSDVARYAKRIGRNAADIYGEGKKALSEDYDRVKNSPRAQAQLAKILALGTIGGAPDLAHMVVDPLAEYVLDPIKSRTIDKVFTKPKPRSVLEPKLKKGEKGEREPIFGSISNALRTEDGYPIGGSEHLIKRAQQAGLVYGTTRPYLDENGQQVIDPETGYPIEYRTGRFSLPTEIGGSILGGLGLSKLNRVAGKGYQKYVEPRVDPAGALSRAIDADSNAMFNKNLRAK
jgi:hypothetical protein